MVLATSSPLFKKLLGRSKNPHPLIFMRGVKSEHLLPILDFLYRGEANVFQENLDSFLAIADELHVMGLVGKTYERVEDPDVDVKYLIPKLSPTINTNTKIPNTSINSSKTEKSITLAFPSKVSGDLEELVKSMMEKSQNKIGNGRQKADICKVCGKEGMGSDIKDHIEANHLEGIIVSCNFCEKTFRTRAGLRHHKVRKTNCKLPSQ